MRPGPGHLGRFRCPRMGVGEYRDGWVCGGGAKIHWQSPPGLDRDDKTNLSKSPLISPQDVSVHQNLWGRLDA